MCNTNDSPPFGSVTIIGAGWLGLPLAKSLLSSGAQVRASATTAEGVVRLIDRGLAGFRLALPEIQHHESLRNTQSLVISIPPRLRQGQTDYSINIKALIDCAEQSGSAVENILLLSSTAVYNGLSGEIDESAQLDLTAQKVAAINSAEQLVLNAKVRNRTVLRLAGLLGEERHPGRFFKHGRAIPNPDSVVNLIHRDDVIGLITRYLSQLHLAAKALQGQHIINCVAPNHPKRGSFYRRAAIAAAQPQPDLGDQREVQGKQVISRASQALDYSFKYPDLLAWLSSSNDESWPV